MSEERPITGTRILMEMSEKIAKNATYRIYDLAHRQAMIFGAGFIRIDFNGNASNVSLEDVYKEAEFIKDNRMPDVKDPVEMDSWHNGVQMNKPTLDGYYKVSARVTTFKPTGRFETVQNPSRWFFQFWKPKTITREIYEPVETFDGEQIQFLKADHEYEFEIKERIPGLKPKDYLDYDFSGN